MAIGGITERVSTRIKASIIELFSRKIDYVESKDYYTNGDDNLYPYEIERVTQNSSTASRAISVGVKFICGKDIVFNNSEKDGYTQKFKDYIQSKVRETAINLFRQNGVFIKINYKLDDKGDIVIDKNRIKVMEYVRCRIGKKDDDGNPPKIAYYDWYSDSNKKFKKQNKEEIRWFYPFNPKKDVVLSQIKEEWKKRDSVSSSIGSNNEKALTDVPKMISNFSGQVMYVNLNPEFVYALSRFDPVFDDCDSEYRISLYTNSNVREGFLGKTAVVTSGLDEETSNKVVDDLKKWLGAEGSSNLYHLDIDGVVENMDNVMKIIQVNANYDEKLFLETDKRLRRNILGAANNLPEPLIYSSEGSLFGTSGETYREMKLFYNEQTESERAHIEKIFAKLGIDISIVPLIDEENIKKTE